MTVEVKQLGSEPIIVATIYEPVSVPEDPQANRDLSNAIARTIDGPVYRITDFSHFQVTFAQLVQGLGEDIKHSEPNIKHLFVGTGEMVKFQSEAARQEQYGGHDLKLFATLDEALAYARAQMQG